MRVYVSVANQTVEEICYLVYGENYISKIPKVLELNCGLAKQGIYLKSGTEVKLPDDSRDFETKKIVRLFS